MSISNEALQKLAQEIELQAQKAQTDIVVVKSAIAGKHREMRLLELMDKELKDLPGETKLYNGVGKMFVSTSRAGEEKQNGIQMARLKTEISDLNKRLHYLETTQANSLKHLEQIFRSGGKTS